MEEVNLLEYLDEACRRDEELLTKLKKEECKLCTFNKKPKKQQIYGCKTCFQDKEIGFCLACYLECHLDHETFDAGYKRNFDCECGANSISQLYKKIIVNYQKNRSIIKTKKIII